MNKKIIYIVCTFVFIIILVIASLFLNKETTTNQSLVNNNSENHDLNSEDVVLSKNSVVEISDSNSFNNEVLKSNVPVLVDFYASWCGPCKMLAPVIKEIASENKQIKVVKVNVDKVSSVANNYKIHSFPTLVLIKDGMEINRLIGLVRKEIIENFINTI